MRLLLVAALCLGCRGASDTGVAPDHDGDGFPADIDCDDADPTVYPGAAERCDGRDADCNGLVDDRAADAITWHRDADADGYGDPGLAVSACAPPDGFVSDGGDCDDAHEGVNPGAAEACNGLDDDCDGQVDEAVTETWYVDADGDGHGDPASPREVCDGSGLVATATDCDDASPAVHPDADELCNGVDDDCDGAVDEDALDALTWYADADADEHGDPEVTARACAAPIGFVSDGADCDDDVGTVHPGADELCNGVDDDCDGAVDEDAVDPSTWYADADADGYGAEPVQACERPAGHVDTDGDCDDDDDAVHPDAGDWWPDGVDNDCDGTVDQDVGRGSGADGELDLADIFDIVTQPSNSRTHPDGVVFGVQAISGRTLTLHAPAAGLAPGDEVLVINLQGTSAAHGAVGTWEHALVASTSSETIGLTAPLAKVFGESGNGDLTGQVVVVQRVPHYERVRVAAGAVLTASAWDGAGGGVVSFRVRDILRVDSNGGVRVDAGGFAGGDTGPINNCDAMQGESYAGLGTGAPDLGCVGGYNGVNGSQAYEANFGGGGAHITGGGGEHAGGAIAGHSWNTVAVAPAAGGAYGSDDLSRVYLGSGGGGVWNGPGDRGPGGSGGGAILVTAHEIEAPGARAFTARGGDTDHWAQGTYTYGAGGGAGGTVWLGAESMVLGAGAIDATGGAGESAHIRHGGDGGIGRVRLDFGELNGAGEGSGAATAEGAKVSEPDPGWLGWW